MPYGEAPWIFTGRALYQLQLVPVAEAKKHIPPEFRIVSLFGYTLGGFYLARYDDSPCGPFDELVALAGLAWDPPASAAWAARVLVSSAEARAHGRRSCGLPSAAASFETVAAAVAGGRGGEEGKVSTTTARTTARTTATTKVITCPASPSSKEAFDFSHPRPPSAADSLRSSSARGASSRSSSRSCWWHPREEKGSVVVVRNEDLRGGGGGGGGGGWRRRRNSNNNSNSSNSNSSNSSNSNGSSSFGPGFVCSLELPALPRKRRTTPPAVNDNSESSKNRNDNSNNKSFLSSFPEAVSAFASSGPRINMTLPSFSGATRECPGLLKYACDLSARVRLVRPVAVSVVRTTRAGDGVDGDDSNSSSSPSSCLSAVLGGKPLLCLEFGEMRMRVEQPELATVGQKKKEKEKKWGDEGKSVVAAPPRWWRQQQQQPSPSSSSSSSSSSSRGALLA